MRVPGAGIAEDRTNRLQQYNFISKFSLANGNTGNNALLTAIRASSVTLHSNLSSMEEQAIMPDKANTKVQAEQPAVKEAVQSAAENRPNKYRDGRWSIPSKRAKGYAADRKAKVHTYGPKEGKELSVFEAGMRSGYLQCQSDHAGIYKYKKALAEGKSKQEARELSRRKWKK